MKLLDELGIDIVDIGFPAASRIDIETLQELRNVDIRAKKAVLARARKDDIDLAVRNGASRAIVILPASDVLLRSWLGRTLSEAIGLLTETVSYANGCDIELEVFIVDALRTRPAVLLDIARQLSRAKLSTFTIADTVGTASPEKVREFVQLLRGEVPELGVHFHNDLGLATANSLAAILEGASTVHTTIAGVGERAGNASLEEIVTSLYVLYGNDTRTNIKLSELRKTEMKIASLLGIPIAPNKPVLGANVFRHESDIHVASILNEENAFSPFPPSLVGADYELVFGKLTGRRALSVFLEKRAISLDDTDVKLLLEEIKEKTRIGGFLTANEVERLGRTYEMKKAKSETKTTKVP